jgi:hypothetical protein
LSQNTFVCAKEKIVIEGESAIFFGNNCHASDVDVCSGGKALVDMSSSQQAYADYKISASEGAMANASIKLSYIRDKLIMSNVLKIVFNGVEIDLSKSPVHHTCDDYKSFAEFPLGQISLKKGDNDMRISSVGGGFWVDYISFSPVQELSQKSVVLEAESALVGNNGYPVINEHASGKKVLANVDDGKFTLTVNAERACIMRAEIRFVYCDSYTPLTFNSMMGISVNGKNLVLEDGWVNPTASSQFRRVFIGNVFLHEGENKIVVNSNAKNVYYDCIALYGEQTTTINGNGKTNVDVQTFATMGGSALDEHDGTPYVSYNNYTTCISFMLNATDNLSLALSLDLSYWGTKTKIDEVLFITINGYLLNLKDLNVSGFQGDNQYYEVVNYNLGDVSLERGANVITITAVGGKYNLFGLSLG